MIASRPHLSADPTSRLWPWQKLKAAEVNAMTDLEFRVVEDRMRRAAQRRGLRLIKSRRRDPRAIDYGLYVLIEDSARNRTPGAQAPISAFARGEGLTLAEVAEELLG